MTRLNLRGGVIFTALVPLLWVACNTKTEAVRTIPGGETTTGTGGATVATGTGGAVGTTGTGGATGTGTGGTTGTGSGGTAAGAGGTPVTGTGGAATTGTGGTTVTGTGGTNNPDGSVSTDGATDALDPNRPIKVLVWNNALTYGHQSRVTAIPLLVAAGTPFNIQFDVSHANTSNPPPPEGLIDNGQADGSVFNDAGLDPFDVVFFLNTTGNTLNVNGQEAAHKQALMTYMEQKGRGYVGTHSATDTYQGNAWTWYVDFVGANFVAHSNAGTPGTARYQVGVTHPILTIGTVPNPWNRSEEWYTFTRDVTSLPGVTVLLTCTDTGTDANRGQRPITWVKNLTGGGRVFYTAFGHDVSAFREPQVMNMIMTGIRWAAHRIN